LLNFPGLSFNFFGKRNVSSTKLADPKGALGLPMGEADEVLSLSSYQEDGNVSQKG
jgi:hypothetical protein